MVYFGPADLENMANDMQQWAGSRRGIYKVMEASAKRGQNDACGPWRKIGGAGGVGCEETTEHQYVVLTTSVHTKF